MILNVADILQLDAWIARGTTEEERERRIERVRERVFPAGLEEKEVQRRLALIESAKKIQREKAEDPLDPMPTLPAAAIVAEPAAQSPPWDGFISHSSKAYRRGSLHDGTQAEVDRMRDAARGSPFDADPNYRPIKR